MKLTVRTAALAAIFAALFFTTASAELATVVKPKQPVVRPDDHPVPVCPPGVKDGCGIYS